MGHVGHGSKSVTHCHLCRRDHTSETQTETAASRRSQTVGVETKTATENTVLVSRDIRIVSGVKMACFHKLLSFGAKPDSRDTFGNTPCHYAAEDGDVTILDVLLRHRAVDPNAQV